MQFYFVMQLQVSIVHIRRNRCAQRTYMVHDVHASNGSMREHTTRLSERAIIYDDNQMTIICDINSIISNYYVFYVAVRLWMCRAAVLAGGIALVAPCYTVRAFCSFCTFSSNTWFFWLIRYGPASLAENRRGKLRDSPFEIWTLILEHPLY